MLILKRTYKKPSLAASLLMWFRGKKTKQDHYPYIVNIGFHANVINLVTCAAAPSEVMVNGKPADARVVESLIERLKVQFKYKNCDYVLEVK